jgi:hypothetical protein
MEQGKLNWITGYIWGIADDVLRDLKARASRKQLKADFEISIIPGVSLQWEF